MLVSTTFALWRRKIREGYRDWWTLSDGEGRCPRVFWCDVLAFMVNLNNNLEVFVRYAGIRTRCVQNTMLVLVLNQASRLLGLRQSGFCGRRQVRDQAVPM